MTTIDFNALMEEAGEGFQPIPPGPYTIEVAKTESTTSSTNKPMIRAQLRILGGPHNGRIVFDQYTVSAGNPRALGFFFDTMAAFGLDRAYFAANPPVQTVAQVLLGRQCNVQVGMKQYQGVDRNEVKNYRPLQGGAPAPAAPVAGVPQMGAMPVAPQQQPMPQGVPQPQQPQQQPAAPWQPQTPQAQEATNQFLGQFGGQQAPPEQQQAPAPQQMPPQQPQPVSQDWAQQAAQQEQPAPQPQQMPPQAEQPAPMPQVVQPGQQQGQPQEAPMWQPSAPPPGVAPEQQQQQQPAPQPVAPPPGVVPPTPQVPGQPPRSI